MPTENSTDPIQHQSSIEVNNVEICDEGESNSSEENIVLEEEISHDINDDEAFYSETVEREETVDGIRSRLKEDIFQQFQDLPYEKNAQLEH